MHLNPKKIEFIFIDFLVKFSCLFQKQALCPVQWFSTFFASEYPLDFRKMLVDPLIIVKINLLLKYTYYVLYTLFFYTTFPLYNKHDSTCSITWRKASPRLSKAIKIKHNFFPPHPLLPPPLALGLVLHNSVNLSYRVGTSVTWRPCSHDQFIQINPFAQRETPPFSARLVLWSATYFEIWCQA